MRQALSDRMVVLLVNSARDKSVPEPNIQSVMHRMNKRYGLELDTSREGITGVLAGLAEQALVHVSMGRVSLGDSGPAFVERVLRLQPSFCNKFVKEAGAMCPDIAGATGKEIHVE